MAETNKVLNIILKFTQQGKDNLDKAGAGLKKFNSAFQDITGVSLGAAGALAAVGSALRFSVNAAMESEKVKAATQSVIRSTGGAAGMTADQIAALAQSESELTSIDDEVVQGGMNMLLTFKGIGKDAFPRATRAMEDMAVAMAKGDTASVDLQGTAIQLGKALNDPITGMTALRRVGVNFSATQKEQIQNFMEQNDLAGAQAIILGELESEFGGMAETMGNTAAGKIQKAKNALENLGESIGNAVLPAITWLAEKMADGLDVIASFGEQTKKVNSLLREHKGEVLRTAKSYDDYVKELKRAATAAGYRVLADGRMVTAAGKVVDAQYVLTEETYATAAAIEDFAHKESLLSGPVGEAYIASLHAQAEATELTVEQITDLKQKQSELALFMSGPLGKENEKYASSQADLRQKMKDVAAEMDNLATKTSLSGDEAQKLADLRGEYDELAGKYRENADEHELATKRILFDLVQQRLAADGVISEDDLTLLSTLAENWGLVDQGTKDAYASADELLGSWEDGNTSLEDTIRLIDQVGENLGELPEEIKVRVLINAEMDAATEWAIGHSNGSASKGGYAPEQFGGPVAGGTPYIVGERRPEVFVPETNGRIYPSIQSAKAAGAVGGGGAPVNITINAYNGLDLEEAYYRLEKMFSRA
jgi:predicted nuclease with TOPRIM domain